MSGIETAGLVLGVFPLIVSGLEHWHNAAKIGGFYWRIQHEYNQCRDDVSYHRFLYKQSLKRLLLPILNDVDEVDHLVGDPDNERWGNGDIQELMRSRLQDAYDPHLVIIRRMKDAVIELKKELSFDKSSVQSKLAPQHQDKNRHTSSSQLPTRTSLFSSTKAKLDYETFRVKFSFREHVRKELFGQLESCNKRLMELLDANDKMFKLSNTPHVNTRRTASLETVFKKAWRKSDLLFKALQKAWACSCQEDHFANLRLEHRLEHRRVPEIYFEIILMFVARSSQMNPSWSWRELQCGEMVGCSFCPNTVTVAAVSQTSMVHMRTPAAAQDLSSVKRKQVAFRPFQSIPMNNLNANIDPDFKLCQLLSVHQGSNCMGIIGHGDETYHLHPLMKRRQSDESSLLTLDHLLSTNAENHLSRLQRYFVALLLASSVAQLQSTPWLRTGLTKKDIVFFPSTDNAYIVPYREPFVRQGFSLLHFTSPEAKDRNFYSLGILLLELCFGQRLEDHPLRKKYETGVGATKQVLDLAVAVKWSQIVDEEGGPDYASAVKWCFNTRMDSNNNSWRGEIIRNVIMPLEACQEHFKAATMNVY